MSEHRIDLNAKESGRLSQLKLALDIAQQTYGAALGMAVDHANLDGQMTGLEFQGDHLLVTLADPPSVPPHTP